MPPTANGHAARIDELQRRADNSVLDRQRVWERISAADRQMGVIENEVRHVREDIDNLDTKFSGQMRWVNRGLWTGAGFFAVLVVSVAGLILDLGA